MPTYKRTITFRILNSSNNDGNEATWQRGHKHSQSMGSVLQARVLVVNAINCFWVRGGCARGGTLGIPNLEYPRRVISRAPAKMFRKEDDERVV